jgi:hypothetical protein
MKSGEEEELTWSAGGEAFLFSGSSSFFVRLACSLFSGDGGDGGSAVPFACSQPSLLLSFASVPAVPLLLCPLFLFSFLFFPAFSVLVMKR